MGGGKRRGFLSAVRSHPRRRYLHCVYPHYHPSHPSHLYHVRCPLLRSGQPETGNYRRSPPSTNLPTLVEHGRSYPATHYRVIHCFRSLFHLSTRIEHNIAPSPAPAMILRPTLRAARLGAGAFSPASTLAQRRLASSLVFLEHKGGKLNDSSLTAVTAAKKLGDDVSLLSARSCNERDVASLCDSEEMRG